MRYYVQLDPNPAAPPVSIDIVELPSGALQANIEGKPVDVDVVSLGASTLSVRVDGKVVDLTTDGAPPEMGAVASGHRAYVRVESERMRSAEQAKKIHASGGDKVIKSPMPGRVVKVLVQAGAVVTAGQGVIVLEAMKMENEVVARAAGVVSEIHVTVGAAVEGHAKLVTIA